MTQPLRHEIKDYELLNALGSGSYSTVYRARHKQSRDYVAVKTVAKSGLSKTATDNLLQEIKLLKTLRHKYIVEMVDFMWDDKNIYILMELCAAGDLSAYIRRHRRLPESTCRFFLRQLAIALRYMRSHNVSHFDLKPHNLLLTHTPALTLKVADFGFAQHLRLDETNTALKGSPLYMAPEILLHRRYDAAADLWSIGCILYECLFGAAPYRSRSLAELLQKVQCRQRIELPPPPPPTTTTPTSDAVAAVRLSATCEDLLSRLLVHEPADRIGFDEFFAHEFLDVAHEPTDENLGRAVQLVTRAVELDRRGELVDAYAAYCEGLQYFVPLIAAEADPQKRQQLRHNADSYLRRAEEIRDAMTAAAATASAAPPTTTRVGGSGSVQRALQPAQRLAELRAASESSPQVRDGLDIGRQAELYMHERNYGAAIVSYRGALGVLVPALAAEPKGTRRERLHRQVSDWMHEAEQVKVLLAAQQLRDNGAGEAADEGRETAATAGSASSVAAATSYASNCCLQ